MSLKDLFKEQNYKYLGNSSVNSLTSSGVESAEFVEVFVEDRDRFIPLVDYSLPENFARFGSAEKYYYDSIKRVYNTYPYDGSRKEKIQWELSSSGLDLYLFENGYPRTNGFAVFSSASLTATDVSTDYTVWGSYGAAGSGTYEFVSFHGGPHAGEGSNIYIDPDTGEAHYRKDANVYDLSKNRESNLKIGGNDGNTVEFWLKKAAFNVDATQTEVLFDIFTTSSISSSVDYGRLTVEMSGHGAGTNTLSPFYVTYMSGTAGISKQNIGASLTTSSVADDNWHHYSFRFKNDGANTSVDLFVDGLFNHNVKAGTTVDYVSGTIVGTIGALATNPSGSAAGAPTAARGWGKLSGSLDEFRFWKVWRTSKQVQTRWFDQVAGGTNTDDANTHLGLYYKFNEGITQTASTDSNVLDYSGRVSNGSWNGYSSIHSRETGSAINDSGLTTYVSTEFLDPIIYSFHPEVISYLDTKRAEGKDYDYGNPSTLYYSLPSWIIEEHDANNPDNDGLISNSLWNLTQILSSHFDSTANLMKSLPDLSQDSYVSGSQKPIPFMGRILESKGFVAPEIFNALDALEYFENRDSNTSYEEKIANVKNIIYKNIYNNLTYINKSKGAEKSFRNLIRCFGINDEIYKLNYYSNNVDYILEDNFRSVSDKFKLINFNSVNNSDASVFQYSSSINANSTTFISASNKFTFSESPEYSLPFSVEAGMIFPNRVNQSDYATFNHNYGSIQNDYPLMLTASLFGMHTARGDSPADTTWNTNDYANFVVKAVKPETFSDKAKFVLTGTAGGFIPELSSSFYDDVYADTPWNFLFCLYPVKYPNANEVDGAENSPYVVEFSGMQKVLDETINQFTVTGSITAAEATKILASPKRVFVGAHRTNFTGSTLQQSDVKFNTVRVWQNKLDIKDLSLRGSDPNNYSIKNPEQNAYLFNESNNRVYVPNKETLLLHWNFNNVTGSDSSGEFIVEDLTSGSINEISRYGILSDLSNKQFTGLGFEFAASSKNVVIIDDFVTAKPNIPEVLANENTVNVMTNDDIYYTRDSRPTFFDLYIEKSAYQNISEEMLKFMATVTDFNDLIGHTVDRYRDEYKALSILRQAFFETMDAPNVEKYMEYFKWFDLAVSAMIQQLAPMSSGLGERPLRNIIESHILERNKYQSKFPTYEFKQSDPEGRLFGINEMLYPWKEGHAPLTAATTDQDDNCLWLKERAERSVIVTSGDTNVDSDRQEILDVINNLNNATAPNFKGPSGTYQGSTYALRRFARPYKINAVKEPEIHGGGNAHENKKVGFWDSIRKRPSLSADNEGGLISIEPPDSKLESFKDCDDNLVLNKGKRKYRFSVGVSQDGAEAFSEVYKGDLVFPFGLYSSSVNSNPAYADLADFQENLAITNLHHDNYGPFADVPMQGPFTEKYVGGRPYRHVMTNLTVDNENPDEEGERLEGWRLTGSADALDLVNVDPANPKSVYFREEYAKRPVNIKNIQQLTGANETQDQATDASGVTKIGNYTNTYEVVMTNGRAINNRYLAESEGDLASTFAESEYLSGAVDFALPRRDLIGKNKAIIVNRFAAPGDVSTMAEGFLDIAAGEYSVYNALPYRNLAVRQPLQELLTDHANQFGLFSDARTVADFELYNEFHTRQENYPGGTSSISDHGADLFYIGNDGVAGTGSFHKVNRNGRKQPMYSNQFLRDSGTVSIDTKFDNFFVQHQLPQTDVQYSWITASLIENYTGSALFGFEQPDFSNASLASTDLTFATSSHSGSDEIKVDFAGINTLVLDDVSSATNLLSSSDYFNDDIASLDDVLTTNAILSHRGGPAGGSNWKLYRKDNHPIVRAHKEENRLSFLKPVFVFNSEEKQALIGGKGAINSVIEPPITSKYAQLSHRLTIKQGETEKEITINHSYMNNIRFFTDHTADNIDLDDSLLKPNRNTKTDQQMLDVINYYLYQASDFNNAEDYNPISGLISYTTRETIFPREQYTYLSTHRQREDYRNSFWRDNIDDRRDRASGMGRIDSSAQLGTPQAFNPYGFVYHAVDVSPSFPGLKQFEYFGKEFYEPAFITASIWSMDARENYETDSPGRIASGTFESFVEIRPVFNKTLIVSGTDGSGILQNALMPYSQVNYVTGTFNATGESVAPLRPINGFVFPQYNRRIAGMIGSDISHEYKFGDTKWEADILSGKTPFYDTYSDYVDEIKRCGKNYGLVPEFRISSHMDFYLNDGENGFLTEPVDGKLGTKGFLEVTGALMQDSSDPNFAKTYSHTDFLKTFALVEDLYGNETITSKITLSADALIKFLPYDGFYPAQRTVQLSGEFYNSYSASFFCSGNIGAGFGDISAILSPSFEPGQTIKPEFSYMMNPIWKPLFAPGILYNSIKSGIAVDYPIHTSDRGSAASGSVNQRNVHDYLIDIPRVGLDFDFRVPFEALLDPENEFAGNLVVESEPHPSASLDLTASLAGPGTLNYKLAMNNFLASTIDFFKPDGKLTTIASLADNDVQFGNQKDPFTGDNGFQVGKEYRMRIACYNGSIATTQRAISTVLQLNSTVMASASFQLNPPTCVMYAQTGSVSSGPLMTADYYGSAFGPPCDNKSLLISETDSTQRARLFSSASFEPFTPPYYDGYSDIEFVFRPTLEDDFQSFADIFNSGKMTQEVFRSQTGFNFMGTPGIAERNKMHLSASINLAFVHKPTTVFDALGNPIEVADAGTNDGTVLTIQPKWECPILNFKDVSPSLPAIGSGSVARGMWHQYGVKPSGSDGIFLQVQDLDRAELDNAAMTGSLAAQLGLSTLARRLGTVAEKKKISEAVVAIPFFVDQNNTTKRFFIDRQVVDVAEGIVDTKQAGLAPVENKIQPDDSIVDMVAKMKKFVIPPHLDFVTNQTINPFAMFIFDFEVELTEKDLTDIWQNLPPEVGTSFQKTQASLPVEVFSPSSRSVVENGTVVSTPFSLMKSLPENTRWMVFKVKQRSEKNYFTKTADSSDDDRFKFNFQFGSANAEKLSVPDYSYNWPFDFFSLVELAKIDAEVESLPLIDSGKSFDKQLLDNILGVIGDDVNAPKVNPPKLDTGVFNQGVAGDPGINQFAQPGGPATPAPSGAPTEGQASAGPFAAAAANIFTTPVSSISQGLSVTQAALSPTFGGFSGGGTFGGFSGGGTSY